MAQIRLLAWNIQVYGNNKFNVVPNRLRIVQFVALTIVMNQANVVVLMELIDSEAAQICQAVVNDIAAFGGGQYAWVSLTARDTEDREAYGILWQTPPATVNFDITRNNLNHTNIAISDLEFPRNADNGSKGGRRAAVAVFRTTDTNTNFAVAVYHAPTRPNQARKGIIQLAKTAALYSVNRGGNQEQIPYRLLAGDYNLDVGDPYFGWLTAPLPPVPPPAANGEGADTIPMLPQNTPAMYTHLVQNPPWDWPPYEQWPKDSVSYRNLQTDNIFYTDSGVQPNRSVIDLIQQIRTTNTPFHQLAQQFVLTDQNGQPAFPDAKDIDTSRPATQVLQDACYAYLLYCKAISDHLPVFLVHQI